MAPRGLSRFDIDDLEIIDAIELKSDGTTVIMTGVTVVSTTYSTKRVVVSGVYLVNEPDQRIELNDKVTLTGTSGGLADGNYTVATVVDDTTFTVIEAIANSTGGVGTFYHPPGALRIGFDPTGLTHTTAHEVQDAIKDLDGSVGGITDAQHRVLRHLIHFVETNSPGDGFGTGPYHCETNYTGGVFPTDETWWETSSKLKKICRWECTYNINKTFATEKWIVYKTDGTNPAADATDTITYTGVRENSRSRAVVVY
jgi:hypothetical protein